MRERATAAAVLAAAVGVAAWLLHEPPRAAAIKPPPPKPITQAKLPAPKPSQTPLAIELIDISALDPAPPAPLPTPRQEAPAPIAAPSPPLPEVKVAALPPPPQKVAEPEPVKTLVPEPEREPATPPVAPLRAAPIAKPPAPAFAPLKPGDEKITVKAPPRDTKTLLEAAAKIEKERTQPEFKPLQPGDEKVTVKRTRPVPLPEPKVVKAPPPQRDTKALIAAAARIENTVEKAEPPRAAPAVVSKEAIGEGRALLRILEQGSGPSIEIGWPDDEPARNRLYSALKSCLGMRTGLLDGAGRLYLAEGARSQPTDLNTDLYSGFVRRPEGAIAAAERSEIEHVRAYHAQRAAPPARLFPRRVDAYLIGGLRQAVGENYLSLKSIRASYRLDGEHVIVDGIVADGRAMSGAIDFSAVARCG